MQQHIFDIDSHEPKFYVEDGVVFDEIEHTPRFSIRDQYWIPYLSAEKWPIYMEDGKYVYAYPPEQGPLFYYR